MDNSFIEKIAYTAPSRERYSPELNMVFNEEGTKRWKKITSENIGKHIAVSFNGEILMVPQIFSLMDDGKVTVSAGTEWDGERVSILKCIPAIVGSGTLALPVGCRRSLPSPPTTEPTATCLPAGLREAVSTHYP